MEETERSLHDAIMIVRRAIKVLDRGFQPAQPTLPLGADATLDLCGDPFPV